MTVADRAPLRTVPTTAARRPVVVEVPRHELVGDLMTLQSLATEGMDAVGDALQAIERLYEAVQGTSPRIKAIEHAVLAIHDHQERLFNEATVLAGRYDGVTPAEPA